MIVVQELIDTYIRAGAGLEVTQLSALTSLNSYYRNFFISGTQAVSDIKSSVLIPLERNIDLYFIDPAYNSIFVKEIVYGAINGHMVSVVQFVDTKSFNKTHSTIRTTIKAGETEFKKVFYTGVYRGSMTVNVGIAGGLQFYMFNTSSRTTTLQELGGDSGNVTIEYNFKLQEITVTLTSIQPEDVIIYISYNQVGLGTPVICYLDDVGFFTDDINGRNFRRCIVLERLPTFDVGIQTLQLGFYGTRELRETDDIDPHIGDILVYGALYRRALEGGDNNLIASMLLKLKSARGEYDRKKIVDYNFIPHKRGS